MLRRCTLVFLLLGTLACLRGSCLGTVSAPIDPRNLDASALGDRVDLSKHWLFSPADRPEYASADFDDSGWKAVSPDQELLSYGFRSSPFCWYRLHVRMRPQSTRIVLEVQSVVGAYEIYANGVRIGNSGDMASHALKIQPDLTPYLIPGSALAARPGKLVVAIRFSNQARRYRTRSLNDPFSTDTGIFLQSEDSALHDVYYRDSRISFLSIILGGVEILIGLVALALYLALRKQQEYLAIAIELLAGGLGAGIEICRELYAGSVLYFCAVSLLNGVGTVATLEFVRLILRLPRTRTWIVLEVVAAIGPVSNPLALSGASPVWVVFASVFISMIIMDLLLPALLLLGSWRGNLDARVLLPAILMGLFADYYSFFLNAIFYFHFSNRLLAPWALQLGGYRVHVDDIGSFAFDITILLFIVLRTIRIARERAEAAGEIAAAQTTQQLLLSRASQATPGFSVESVYRPASEVGGDFFLVSPHPEDGSLIAIVGDVSGKGLIAAMRVSMILGVLRRENAREPAVILNQLNEALLTQGEMGFTTACCVRLEHSGRYTLSNAGHISPYVNGIEIGTPPGLPLGLAPDQAYEPVAGVLREGEKLVLMSDGVVEARSAKGELYGFDRLPGLTRMPAAAIADIAQRFGQEDDITVLTIACVA